MSQARDKYFELLVPMIEVLGYTFNKSKFNLTKTIGDAIYTIDFNWDGRGSTTYLNKIGLKIHYAYVEKSLNALLRVKDYPLYWPSQNTCFTDGRIPQMYSKELIQLASNMAFKKMAAMPFEEKYPIEQIKKTVTKSYDIIVNKIIPIHVEWAAEHKLLQLKTSHLLNKLNEIDTHGIMIELLVVKIMSKKLQIPEPKFVTEINIFSNKSIDDLWNIQEYDFDNMGTKFNQLKF